ncbi:MAG TPA: hypothetical protein EYH22_01820 [Candidatus Nanopusillus sp.]|nr:hypothetical protein [Candidatus Nanopusillus sp.]
MQRRKYVLDQVINLSQTKVDIPTRNIIDGIILSINATYSNSSGSDQSLTDEQLAGAIPEVKVVSDGANTHYALGLSDILIMNYYDTAGKVPRLDSLNTIPAGGTYNKKFTVRLDGGDIVAAIKQSLSISAQVNRTINTDVSLSDLNIVITIDEAVIEDTEELVNRYGENFEFIAEPKITAIETNVSANTSFSGLVELPSGNAIIRSFYVSKTTTGVRSNNIIDLYGVVDKNSTVLYKVPFLTGQDLDRQEYNVDPAIVGVTILDYADEMAPEDSYSELFDDEFGVKGWNFVKGDYLDAFKVNSAGTIRIIRHELICEDGITAVLNEEIDEEELPEDFGWEI